jgi:hypothetical protein
MFSQKFTDLWDFDSNWKKFKKFWGEALIRRRLHITDPNWSPYARVEYISNFIHTARIGSFSNTFHSTRNFCMNTIIFLVKLFQNGWSRAEKFRPQKFRSNLLRFGRMFTNSANFWLNIGWNWPKSVNIRPKSLKRCFHLNCLIILSVGMKKCRSFYFKILLILFQSRYNVFECWRILDTEMDEVDFVLKSIFVFRKFCVAPNKKLYERAWKIVGVRFSQLPFSSL